MNDSQPLSPVRLEEQRERLVRELSAHFAHDHLDTPEFERRLDLAYRATTLAEMQQLRADLPALPAAASAPPALERARPGEVRRQQFVLALMGGTERKGVWTPARSIDAVAFMGGVVLDFREARFPPGVTRVNALAFMGGIEILVPPGVRVESSGTGILGGFESFEQPGDESDPDAPVLQVSGVAIMGGVEISQRLRGESAKQARQRLRAEQRRLRDERRRLGGGP
jgi:hypothetical protein